MGALCPNPSALDPSAILQLPSPPLLAKRVDHPLRHCVRYRGRPTMRVLDVDWREVHSARKPDVARD
jgi:hypothetical protein